MIEVVTLADFEHLQWIDPERSRANQEAFEIIIDIVSRLPRPRAYVTEPTEYANSDDFLWHEGHDILVTQLTSAGIGVIDPYTLRALIHDCPVLLGHGKQHDPFWQAFVASKMIDQVWLPDSEYACKRHSNYKSQAEKNGIRVCTWKVRVT